MADNNEETNEDISLRDVMKEIRQQRIEVQNLREGVHGSSESISSEVNKLKKAKDIVWKYTGNKIQFEFNEDLKDTVSQVVWAVNNDKLDYSKELCEELQKKIKRRNKLIRLADYSKGGWETVKQYETNPIASDSDDENKMQKAENRVQKRKRDSSRGRTGYNRLGGNRQQWGSATFPVPSTSSTGQGLFRGYNSNFASFNGNGWNAQGSRPAVGRGAGPGPCFACGDRGHIRRYCPRMQTPGGAAGIQLGGKPE